MAEKPAVKEKPRNIAPQEERFKRGRWVLPLLLVASVMLSLYFWFLG